MSASDKDPGADLREQPSEASRSLSGEIVKIIAAGAVYDAAKAGAARVLDHLSGAKDGKDDDGSGTPPP